VTCRCSASPAASPPARARSRAQIAQRFPDVIDLNGRLDRAALAARIFGNPADREALNAIVHPRVREAVLQRSIALAEAGVGQVIYDAPLLIENGLHEGLDGVILVVAERAEQRRRLMARNQLTVAQADARIDAQLPLDEKRRFATFLIDNGGSLEATRAQVDGLAQALRARRSS
jgi:dephospho-CoA kinase